MADGNSGGSGCADRRLLPEGAVLRGETLLELILLHNYSPERLFEHLLLVIIQRNVNQMIFRGFMTFWTFSTPGRHPWLGVELAVVPCLNFGGPRDNRWQAGRFRFRPFAPRTVRIRRRAEVSTLFPPLGRKCVLLDGDWVQNRTVQSADD